jgi:hypothetical protein
LEIGSPNLDTSVKRKNPFRRTCGGASEKDDKMATALCMAQQGSAIGLNVKKQINEIRLTSNYTYRIPSFCIRP